MTKIQLAKIQGMSRQDCLVKAGKCDEAADMIHCTAYDSDDNDRQYQYRQAACDWRAVANSRPEKPTKTDEEGEKAYNLAVEAEATIARLENE